MTTTAPTKPMHPWTRHIHVSYVPGPRDALVDAMVPELLAAFARLGHGVEETPTPETDVVLTTARFGEPLEWREATFFSLRRTYGLVHQPTLYTIVHAQREEFDRLLAHFGTLLQKEPPDPRDYEFPGLSPTAYHVLVEQGRRGGPILALERLVQAQAMSIRVLLVVGDQRAEDIYHFDLVGAYPTSAGATLDEVFEDTARRIATTVSTTEVTAHEVVGEAIPHSLWQTLETPTAMAAAGRELGRRGFFTEMVRIADLVSVPAVTEGVASQYSEGCFSTWDATLGALVATVTGSARPVDKGEITEDDLAVIAGVREDGVGAQVREVDGKRNDPPSSEAVEMMDMDRRLPQIDFHGARVPVVRSKLHGHRGIAGYDPGHVEFVPLEEPYYHYLVSCATDAQAQGIKGAFERSQAMRDPGDPRAVAFTVLPGHGCFIAEKWVDGKAPFQTMWEFMDAGYLEIESPLPQGPMRYEEAGDGRMMLAVAPEHARPR
ncbi:MAG TPA: hypothetical protein VH650_01595 [Gaiellaceae bacterium]